MSKVENKVLLNAEEMGDFLVHIIENNRTLQEKGMVPVCVNIEGHAGLGKTAVATQLAKRMNLDLVRLNLAQLEELGD